MQPLATTYAEPAKICGYTYSRPEPTPRNLSAMSSETLDKTLDSYHLLTLENAIGVTYRWLAG